MAPSTSMLSFPSSVISGLMLSTTRTVRVTVFASLPSLSFALYLRWPAWGETSSKQGQQWVDARARLPLVPGGHQFRGCTLT